MEDILQGKPGKCSKEALEYIDVLVDGRFVEDLKSEDCLFRGSKNQRLVDVPESLKQGIVVDYQLYAAEKI